MLRCTILALLAASALASPIPTPSLASRQASDGSSPEDTSDCPVDSFAIFTGPSKNDGLSGYPWIDLVNNVRAITKLETDTPERSALRIEDDLLKPAVINPTYVAAVTDAGGSTIQFFQPEVTEQNIPIVPVVSKVSGKCYVRLQAGDNKFLSMQNYKGYMHLTPADGYSSRWWGEGPFEMIPWASPWTSPASNAGSP